MRVVRRHVADQILTVLVRGERRSVLFDVSADGTTCLLSSPGQAALDRLVADLRARADATDVHPGTVPVTLWRQGRDGSAAARRLSVPSWSEIVENYPPPVRDRLELLMGLDIGDARGRLGPLAREPGTGKTSAVMALIREWSPWCDTHVVSDPERMFDDADYLLTVLNHSGRRGDLTPDGRLRGQRWKLVVAEDAEEYLRSDARRRSGSTLGRLLNATDGLLGHSLRRLVLLTTNDDVGRLHCASPRIVEAFA